MTIVFFFLNYSSIEDAIITMIQLINKTAVENIAKSLVIVMGASSDHFGELLSTSGSFQCYHKETTIFLFNLGLTTHEIHMIRMLNWNIIISLKTLTLLIHLVWVATLLKCIL